MTAPTTISGFTSFEPPIASVIVLGFNGREHVHACLASLIDQDFDRPYEVVFVDNASSDGTADLAEKFEGVRVHRLAKNYGYCGGNNVGAELADGNLLVFLNQDVVLHRAWLRELVAAVEDDPTVLAGQASVIHPWNPEFGRKERNETLPVGYFGELSPLGFVEYRRATSERATLDTLFLSGVSIILKRDALAEIGGYIFDRDMFLYGEDMDLALRIHAAGYRTVVATRAVVYHAHTLQDQLSLRSFLKTVRIIRNRLLALWKSSDGLEFAALAMLTLAGAPFNSSQFGLPAAKKLAYFFLLIPPTIVAGLAAAVAMPAYAGRRREALRRRRVRRGWLLRTLLFDRGHLSGAEAPERA